MGFLEVALINNSHSASWKQQYISVLNEIYNEAIWRNPKIQNPTLPHFSRKRNRKDVFTYEEIQILFQQKNFENLSLNKDTAFLFFYCIFAAELRLGEARALQLKQFIFDKNALVVDGFLRQDGETIQKIVGHTKIGMTDYYTRLTSVLYRVKT